MEEFLKKPEKIFFIICIFWSLIFMLVNPPFQGSDEDSHLFKIYGFTQGVVSFEEIKTDNINGKPLGKTLVFSGLTLPQGLVEASGFNKGIRFHPEKKTSLAQTKTIIQIPLKSENKVFLAHPVTQYTPLSYFPAVLIIWFMTLFGSSPFAMLTAGRLCSLFVYLICGYFAIKITPVKKWLFLSILLIPMAVYQSSVVSTDALSNGLVILFCAFCLYLACSPEVSKIGSKENVIFLLLALLIGICKFVYFPLVFLYFLIPQKKFDYEKQRGLSFVTIFLISGFVSFCLVGAHLYLTRDIVSYSTTISGHDSLKFVLMYPFEYVFMIIKTLIVNAGFYLNGMIGIFGWSDTFLPVGAVSLYAFVLVFCAVSNFEQDTAFCLDIKSKAVLFVCAFLSVVLILTSCFTVFEPDMKNRVINWVQGRYFLPLAPVCLLLLTNSKFNLKTKVFKIGILVLINAVLLVSLITLLKRFYI